MKKISKKPSTALFPIPTVLVTVQEAGGVPNIITIAWTGVLCSNPPTVYIGVQPIRYSYPIIKKSMQYVINIPSDDLTKAVDYCGVVSGLEIDKFKETGLTPIPAKHVNAPLIEECPVNIECSVTNVLSLGSHDAFIAEVLAVHYSENTLKENGVPDLDEIRPYSYCLGEYRGVNINLGKVGFSKTDR